MIEEGCVRKATVKEVPLIAEIVNYYANKGIMLQRPISRIYDNLRDYLVLEYNHEIGGCGALHVTWSDLAEIRSLALKEELIGKGFGRTIVKKLIEEARILEIEKVFVLTYQEEFFEKMGFTVIENSELPHKIWADCLNCIHFPNCNEIAMIRVL